jgi:hypothetical protein
VNSVEELKIKGMMASAFRNGGETRQERPAESRFEPHHRRPALGS